MLSTAAGLVREKVGGSVAIGNTGSKLVRRTKPQAPKFAKTPGTRKPTPGKKRFPNMNLVNGRIL